MAYAKELKRVHKEFLVSQKLKSQDYDRVREDAESFTFHNKRTGKEETYRR